MKTFIFGRTVDDKKGPDNERPALRVDAPSVGEATAAFEKALGTKNDARASIVRVPRAGDDVDAIPFADGSKAAKPKRTRKKPSA